jgi:uncharacterized protein involved in cysteine biosynthesis
MLVHIPAVAAYSCECASGLINKEVLALEHLDHEAERHKSKQLTRATRSIEQAHVAAANLKAAIVGGTAIKTYDQGENILMIIWRYIT